MNKKIKSFGIILFLAFMVGFMFASYVRSEDTYYFNDGNYAVNGGLYSNWNGDIWVANNADVDAINIDQLVGGVSATNGSVFDITLAENAYAHGYYFSDDSSILNIDMGAGTGLNITNYSRINSLKADMYSLISLSAASDYTVLEVGTLESAGFSIIMLKVNVETGEADNIMIWESVSGSYWVELDIYGSVGSVDYIPLIYAPNFNDATFTLGWEYYEVDGVFYAWYTDTTTGEAGIKQIPAEWIDNDGNLNPGWNDGNDEEGTGDDNSDDSFSGDCEMPDPEADEEDEGDEEVVEEVVSTTNESSEDSKPNTAYLLNYALKGSITKYIDSKKSTDHGFNVWAVASTGEFSNSLKYYGLTAGVDKNNQTDLGNVYMGVMAGGVYGELNSYKSDAVLVGIYGGYILDNGLFVDGQATYSWFNVDNENNSEGVGVKAKAGYKVSLTDSVYVTPSTSIDYQDFSGDYNSLIGRGGVKVGYEVDSIDVYAKVNYGHEFNSSFKGDLIEYGVGIKANITEKISVSGGLSRTDGKKLDEKYAANLSLSVSF